MNLPFRFSVLSRCLPVLNGGLVIVAGLLAAYWTWTGWSAYRTAFDPAREITAREPDNARPLPGASSVVAANLFGTAGVLQIETAGRLGQRLKLLGTFSGWREKPEYALIAVDGARPAPFAKGEEPLKGVVLREVGPEHVVLARDGGAERLEMSTRKDGASFSPPHGMPRFPR